MTNKVAPQTKSCPRCSKLFQCSTHSGDCWCNNYRVSEENLQHLKQTYSDCLCPDCLALYASELKK